MSSQCNVQQCYNCGMPRIHEHIKVEKCCNVYALYEVKNVKLPNSVISKASPKRKEKKSAKIVILTWYL